MLQELLIYKNGGNKMSIKEIRRRKIARTVLLQAWNYSRKTELYRLSFASSLKLAWKTVRSLSRLIHTKLRGVIYYGRQLLLRRLQQCSPEKVVLYFKRDYNNFYDIWAVQIIAMSIITGLSAPIGYLSSTMAAYVAPFLDSGKMAVILSWNITGLNKQYLGCNLTYTIQ
jgi:hypothetical protein